jgi:methyl-accepting chemotaxis protein
MNALNNLKIGVKLVGSYLFIALIIVVVAVVSYFNMQTLDENMTDMYDNRLLPVVYLGNMETYLYAARGDVYRYLLLPDERTSTEQAILANIANINKEYELYRVTFMNDEEKRADQEWQANWKEYQAAVAEILALVKSGNEQAAINSMLSGGRASNARQVADDSLVALVIINRDAAAAGLEESDAEFASAVNVLVVVSVIGVALAFGFGLLISNSITNPLARGVAMMQELSKGHLSDRLHMERADEIGVLARAMDSFADDLQKLVGGLKQIALGDLSVDLAAKDAGDEITPAMMQIVVALRGLVSEAGVLTKAAVEGRLSTRGDVSRFGGGYREIVHGVNETLDAVIGPLNVAAEYVDRISKGDIPAPITDNYNGDFNEIKNNINQCIGAVNGMIEDANMLARAAVDGRLATRADASKHQGDFRRIVEGVNETLDAVIGPLNVASNYVDMIARGEIPAAITDKYNGDFDAFKNNLNRLSERLREMITSLNESSTNLGSASAEILSATTQQASGASEQSAAISQTTTTVEEVKAISEQASMRAQEVATASQRTVDVARTGQRAVQDTIESMAQIKERVEGISENLLALSDQTQQIGEIIATVNEIASQSNMLALNASVEAARAGEHGKGFAVVAMEVRSLAEQSRQATEQVKAILSEIQKATNMTVMATEEGVKGVDKGVQLAAQAQESIEQLAAVINQSAQIATQVVAGGQQQQTGMEQIAMAMTNINQATMQSLASTRQAEKSAQNLNDMARQMSQLVSQYRLS